jgi:hypothetical protein
MYRGGSGRPSSIVSWKIVTCDVYHVSCVMCHVSCVMCLVPAALLCYNTSMRIIARGMICLLILSGAGTVRAEPNPDLIGLLNNILTLEMQAVRQCEAHSDQFKSTQTYFDILRDKEETISRLQDVILEIGGEIASPVSGLETYPTILQALTNDARHEIAITRACDELLEKFGHPKVRQVIQKVKDTANLHYMALTNSALAQLVNEQIKHQPSAAP